MFSFSFLLLLLRRINIAENKMRFRVDCLCDDYLTIDFRWKRQKVLRSEITFTCYNMQKLWLKTSRMNFFFHFNIKFATKLHSRINLLLFTCNKFPPKCFNPINGFVSLQQKYLKCDNIKFPFCRIKYSENFI